MDRDTVTAIHKETHKGTGVVLNPEDILQHTTIWMNVKPEKENASCATSRFAAEVIFLPSKNDTSFILLGCKLTEEMGAMEAVQSWPTYRSHTYCCKHSFYLKTPWAMSTTGHNTHTHTKTAM